jgi:hypothetical protein
MLSDQSSISASTESGHSNNRGSGENCGNDGKSSNCSHKCLSCKKYMYSQAQLFWAGTHFVHHLIDITTESWFVLWGTDSKVELWVMIIFKI